MASAFVPSYERGADGTSLRIGVQFSGADLQVSPTIAHTVVTGIDFVNDNPTQIAAKVAAQVRTLAGTVRSNTGALGVTVPANAVIMPDLAKG